MQRHASFGFERVPFVTVCDWRNIFFFGSFADNLNNKFSNVAIKSSAVCPHDVSCAEDRSEISSAFTRREAHRLLGTQRCLRADLYWRRRAKRGAEERGDVNKKDSNARRAR